jgi:Spy/CpxP family protein refolding chaperone
MKILRTLTLVAALAGVTGAAFAGERQALESYVSPAPSLMPIMVKQADELALTAEQKAKLGEWRAKAQAQRVQMEKAIVAERLAINQAMLDGKSRAEVQKQLKTLNLDENKLVLNKLACRDNAKKILTAQQWEKLIALYNAQ